MFEAIDAISPELIWGLFTRGLGLILLISFGSLAGQIVRGAGREGGMPIHRRLDKIREDFPAPQRFLYFPTLLWLSDSDAMLRLLNWAGIIASCLVIYGGEHSFYALLTCYVCYLSLDMAIGLIFPWDCMLFECMILSLFLPATLPLPELAAVAAPAPAITWAFRIAIFRLMMGFGKQKFMGSTGKDLAYLRGFLIAQPLPSPLGWYCQKLPLWMLQSLVIFMFIAEIPVPFFPFFPGDLSIICAFVTAFLMVGIVSMGSFGYFSFLTIVACITLLDNKTPLQLDLQLFGAGQPNFTNAVVLAHTLGACVAFIFNSWVGQSWHLWSTWYRLPRLLQLPFDFFRLLHPFRWLHPFGVFPPNTYPGVKISLLVEVTWDRESWHEVEFNFSPSSSKSPPKWVAPYHPRGDQAVIYETFGLNPTSLISSMVGPWDPYSYGTQPAANVLAQRIAEGSGTDFMKGTVLREHKQPPVAVRISTIMLEPTSLKEHRETGDYWKRSYIGPHLPPREVDPYFWQEFLPEPEMWHFEAIFWRKRSRFGKVMERARRGDEDPLALAVANGGDLSAADVELFWNEVVPMVGLEQRDDFDTLPDLVAELRQRYDRPTQRRLYRVLCRLSMVLTAKLEPLYLGRGLKPLIPAKTYFHLVMLTHHIIGKGRDAYLAACADPRSVAEQLPELSTQTGLYYLGLFRFESLVFEAQKLRLITAIMPPHDAEEKRRMVEGTAELNDFEQLVARLAGAFSGFFDVMPVIRQSFKGPRFDQGYPELYPTFEQLETGEVMLQSLAEPPPGQTVPGGAPAE
ncbi:MAG: lipase maturation factor family protein [Myxococcales bacterium]|nr:lipase maturation factor family protein [Myxococcales bacterium]